MCLRVDIQGPHCREVRTPRYVLAPVTELLTIRVLSFGPPGFMAFILLDGDCPAFTHP